MKTGAPEPSLRPSQAPGHLARWGARLGGATALLAGGISLAA